MAAKTIEERISELERKVRELQTSALANGSDKPWWEKHVGAFKDCSEFDEAMKLGAEYRKSQPNPVDNPDAVTF
ncbi:MAG: hypothetical protein ABJA67_17720 [Chthonomonadales bacterium]